MIEKQTNTNTTKRRGEFVGVIASVRSFSEELKSLRLALSGGGGQCFAQAKAGQFVQLACRNLGNFRCPTPLLRRPFSIAGIEREAEQIHLEILYRVRGPGTNWLAHRSVGESINLLGPLGNGFSLPGESDRQAILVGGGVGLPPMFFLADKLVEAGYKKIVAFAGAGSKDQFIGSLCPVDSNEDGTLKNTSPPSPRSAKATQGRRSGLGKHNASKPRTSVSGCLEPQPVLEQFNRSGTGCILATDDGSCGFYGFVVDALDQYLTEQGDVSGVDLYACGPDGMLRAISVVAEKYDLPCQVCMEAYMACGIGLCQSCVVQVKSQAAKETEPNYKLVCANGPVFDSRAIVWE